MYHPRLIVPWHLVKFEEIAERSPEDLAALDKLADLIIERLDEDDRRKRMT